MTSKINDLAIREYILSNSESFPAQTQKVVHELELQKGTSRIDLAFFGKHFVGIEIKSDCDTLDRLERQAEVYNKCLERIIIFCGSKHLRTVEEKIPSWWGIAVVNKDTENTINSKFIRRPKKNPDFDAYSLLDLLWKEELIEVLNSKGFVKNLTSDSKWNLKLKLKDCLKPRETKKICLHYLLKRDNWKSAY